jgi:uncharacterized membrane protein (UPF0127 family)
VFGYQFSISVAHVATLVYFFVTALSLSMPSTGFAQSPVKMRNDSLTLVTAAGERKIAIEVAETLEEKSRGLMFRTALADSAGMLFPYDRPQELTMWMRNTYIPLDMVFIKADGRVHRIEVRTEPLSERVIASKGDVTAVLELAGGAAERLGLKAGDRVVYSHFGPPKK